MKKYFLIALALLFFGCRHAEEDTQQVEELRDHLEITKMYCEGLTDEHILKRCDRGTFANLANAFCPTGPYDLSRHEWSSGEHHRDIKPNTCFPDHSKSECSPDYFITKAHDWITRNDAAALNEIERLEKYLDENGDRCGEGPSELTRVTHLRPLFRYIKNYIGHDARLAKASFEPGDEDAIADVIPVHNQYLLALYIHAKGRINGSITSVGKKAMEKILEADPASPIFLAVYNRYHDGDQQAALTAMSKDFPRDKICQSDSYRNWGSAPCAIMQITATGILSGR